MKLKEKKPRQRRHKKHKTIKRIDTETQRRINHDQGKLIDALDRAYNTQKEKAKMKAGKQANITKFL